MISLIVIGFVLFMHTFDEIITVKCFSCASSDYAQLWRRYEEISRVKSKPLLFDSKVCDRSSPLQALSPIIDCESTCVTVFEPNFIGGLVTDFRPYTYLRGCADKIFEVGHRRNRPREVDFLRKKAVCLTVSVSEIWPVIYRFESDEHDDVRVCSCNTDGCNVQEMMRLNGVDTIASNLLFLFCFGVLFLLHSLR